jgi:hypothetical protein
MVLCVWAGMMAGVLLLAKNFTLAVSVSLFVLGVWLALLVIDYRRTV